MNKKKQTKNMLMDMTIEEQLLKIQEIAAELENGSLGLEEALAKYEEGVRLLFAGVQVKSTECKNALQS